MAIPPIGSLPSLPDLGAAARAGAPSAAGAGAGAASGATALGAATTGSGFSTMLGNAIDSLNQAQSTASTQEVQAAAGQGTLANTMVAATEASLDTQVATSVMNKALAAYTSIANMTF